MPSEVGVPEGLARAVAMHLTSHPGNEIICLGIDAVGEVLAEVAAPAVRSQEGQRVGEAASQAIHDLATHIGRARLALMPTLEIDVAQSELKLASDAMKALRSALALDSLED